MAAEAARTIGLVDEVVSYEDCIRRADIIVVAVPVGAAVKMVPDILDRFAAESSVCVVAPGELLEKCSGLEVSDL